MAAETGELTSAMDPLSSGIRAMRARIAPGVAGYILYHGNRQGARPDGS